jgi:hypothetical protein
MESYVSAAHGLVTLPIDLSQLGEVIVEVLKIKRVQTPTDISRIKTLCIFNFSTIR